MTFSLSFDQGLCGCIAIGACFFNGYLSAKVGAKRKQVGLKYPAPYDFSNPQAEFNRYQRAAHNYQEVLPMFLTLLAIASIDYPRYAFYCGLIFLTGRYFYTTGYFKSVDGRTRGAFYILGVFGLLGLSLKTVYTALAQSS